MTEKDTLPYKAINVFINRDFLDQVIESILKGKDKLSKEDQIAFVSFLRQYVTILGFRNPARAPLPLQLKAYASAFEEKDEVVAFTISIWTKLNTKLAKTVKTWLESEGWENLSTERYYSENEGFSNDWPKKLTFDKLVKDFKKANPDAKFSRDDLILMVLWISGKLPKEQSDI